MAAVSQPFCGPKLYLQTKQGQNGLSSCFSSFERGFTRKGHRHDLG